ncbi:MAG: prepilin-type N-terminal cleavage/methylation domain-containing protein [Planctomycetota bacterium]
MIEPRHSVRSPSRRPSPRERGGFTLSELLVVISIVVVLMALTVPAFNSMLRSASQARSDTQLQVAVAAARDAAVRTVTGGDTALAFFFDLSGQVRMQVMVSAGTIVDDDGAGGEITRELFVPDPITEPFYLPRGWSARGYIPSGVLRAEPDQLFEDTIRPAGPERGRGQWVFPETAFYDGNDGDNGDARQSFVLRFRAGSGRPATGALEPVLLIDPSPWIDFRRTAPYEDYRADDSTDKIRFVNRVRGNFGGGQTLNNDLSRLLGNESIDTVLAGPAREVALYREIDLANGLGGERLDPVTRTIYARGDRADGNSTLALAETTDWTPEYVDNNTITAEAISNWIEGRDVDSGDELPEDETRDSRLYTVDQSSGSLREVGGDTQ